MEDKIKELCRAKTKLLYKEGCWSCASNKDVFELHPEAPKVQCSRKFCKFCLQLFLE